MPAIAPSPIPPTPIPKPVMTAALPGKVSPAPAGSAPLVRAAKAFEAAFVAEMLAHTGLGRTPEAFGGGAGETGFASFLTRAYGEKLAAHGGFGLAEAIVRAATGGRTDG